MPQEIPVIVSRLRTGLRPSAAHASRNISRNIFYPPASNRSASMGSTEAARFAGYSADKTEISPSKLTDKAPSFQLASRPAKNGGIGSKLTNAQNPYETSSPIPPL